ncbi:MAG: hypothetical protein ACH350_02635 [Parachlamydiaceae bacterium]
MKKLAIAFIGLIIIGFVSLNVYQDMELLKGEEDDFAAWKSFIPHSGLFQVSLPNLPHYGKDFLPIAGTEMKKRYDIYASEQVDGTLFLVSVVTYPPEYDVSLSEEILRKNIDELIHNKPDNRLVKIDRKIEGEHDSFLFVFENQEFEVEGKAIQDGHVVYLLTYTAKKDELDAPEFDHFIDSFKILKPIGDVFKKVS